MSGFRCRSVFCRCPSLQCARLAGCRGVDSVGCISPAGRKSPGEQIEGGAIVGLGAGLRHSAATTDSRRAPDFHRRSPSLPWVIGLVVIPLLIAAIGYGAFDRSRSANGPHGALPTLAPSSNSAAPKLSLAPLSITRNGNNITLNGDFPDDSAKAALMKALKG